MANYPKRVIEYPAMPMDFSSVETTTASTTSYVMGLYAKETTQRFVYGTRYITWDGRVFKYALTSAAVVSYHACLTTVSDAALGMTAARLSTTVGDIALYATLASRTQDDLAGGLVAIYNGTNIDNTQVRGIQGNDASVSTALTLYADAPCPAVTITTDSFEIFENPYKAISGTADHNATWMGVPCVSAAAAYKLWIQTWGPTLVSGGADLTATSDVRTLVFSGASAGLYKVTSYISAQTAGYYYNKGSSAGPTVYLMCST